MHYHYIKRLFSWQHAWSGPKSKCPAALDGRGMVGNTVCIFPFLFLSCLDDLLYLLARANWGHTTYKQGLQNWRKTACRYLFYRQSSVRRASRVFSGTQSSKGSKQLAGVDVPFFCTGVPRQCSCACLCLASSPLAAVFTLGVEIWPWSSAL